MKQQHPLLASLAYHIQCMCLLFTLCSLLLLPLYIQVRLCMYDVRYLVYSVNKYIFPINPVVGMKNNSVKTKNYSCAPF